MSKVKVYNKIGKVVGEVSLDPKIFKLEIKPELIQQAVRTQLANKRKVIAHTKGRSEVRGGGRKPWRQKGTGRARHGSIRSPLWKGGGVTFGPRKNRNYSLKMNRKAKRKALLMTLSDKAKDKRIVVLDKLELPSIKTKEFVKIITKLPIKNKVLTIIPRSNDKIVKSARNIPNVKTINANSINVIDVLNYDYLLVPQDSLAVISKTFLK